jgi:rare lipoprotein A
VREPMKTLLIWLVLCGLLISFPVTCGSQDFRSHRPSLSQSGLVTWYGKKFAGHRMANGQRYDPTKLTTASRTYPIGTKLALFCGKTGMSVIVEVTDRGPVQKSYLLDISESAAIALGIRYIGIARIRIVPVSIR